MVYLSPPNFGIFCPVSAHLDKWDDAHHPAEAGPGSCPLSFAITIYHLNPAPSFGEGSGDTGWSRAPSPPSLAAGAVVGEQSGFPWRLAGFSAYIGSFAVIKGVQWGK